MGHYWLGAMMSRAHGNSLMVKENTHVVGMDVAHKERDNSGLVAGFSDDAQSLNLQQFLCGIASQFFLVGGYRHNAGLLHVLDGFP